MHMGGGGLGKMNGHEAVGSSCLPGLRLDLREQKRKSPFISPQDLRIRQDRKERNGRAAGGKGGHRRCY